MNVVRYTSTVAVVGVALSTAIALASPASAEQLSGTYTATVTDGGQLIGPGATKTAIFTPCGPDCLNLQMNPGVSDLHLQGNIWAGTYDLPGVGTCSYTLDNTSLVLTEDCPSFDMHILYAVTPAGQQPPAVSVPDLPSNDQPTTQPAADQSDGRLSTGGEACVDGVRTYIPPEGLVLGPGNHDTQPYMGQC